MCEEEMFAPVPPVATDNLGVHYEGPVTARIAGAKLPPPLEPPPTPPQDPKPHPASTRSQGHSGKKLVLGGGRRP